MIPNSEIKNTLGFAVHISRLSPSKITLAGEMKFFQLNCRSILIHQQTKVLFIPVKEHWMIGRNKPLMNNVLNLKIVGLPRKAKIPGHNKQRGSSFGRQLLLVSSKQWQGNSNGLSFWRFRCFKQWNWYFERSKCKTWSKVVKQQAAEKRALCGWCFKKWRVCQILHRDT